MNIFYNFFISLLIFGMKAFSLFNAKAKRGLEGRRKSLEIVRKSFSKEDKIIWMHAASLGEYEQGLPVLEKLKLQYPQHKILVTFFSPSGYENVIKKKTIADTICYLPFDTPSKVKEFVSSFSTEIFFTVKYDYWYNLLEELRKKEAKIFVISALFYPKQVFFKSYGRWFVEKLKKNVDWFFHQTESSSELARNIGLSQSSVTGDTRFDRVKDLRNRNNEVEFISDFKENKKTIIFGSSWQAEEKIAKLITDDNKELKIIIAPHDLKRVYHLKNLFPHALLYSELQANQNRDKKASLLIIDCIGLLSKIYSYGDVAVVGGGFHSAGLHNILEAATFGIPVFFGNQYKKNPEADGLISAKGGCSFDTEEQAAQFILELMKDNNQLQAMSKNAEDFIRLQPNSTELILKKIALS